MLDLPCTSSCSGEAETEECIRVDEPGPSTLSSSSSGTDGSLHNLNEFRYECTLSQRHIEKQPDQKVTDSLIFFIHHVWTEICQTQYIHDQYSIRYPLVLARPVYVLQRSLMYLCA